MAENTVTLVGTITRDLELRHTPDGSAVVDIGIAQNKSVRQPDGTWTRDGDPMYFECTVWRDMAEHANATLSKGMRVIVTGRLDYQTWETDGQVRNKIKVIVDEIGPSLRWATANVERTSGSSMGDSPQGGVAPASTPPSNDNEAPF